MPWHIPFHRVEAAASAARTRAAGDSELPSDSTSEQPLGTVAEGNSRIHSAAADASSSSVPLPAAAEPAGNRQKRDALNLSDNAGDAKGPVGDAEGGKAQGGFADGRIDQAKGTVVFKRYYHLFDQGELDALVRQVPSVGISESFYDKSNWCTIFEKYHSQEPGV